MATVRVIHHPSGVDDAATVVAVAALAICTTAFAHEALGHGGACLAAGGRIEVLTNAFFHCSARSRWLALAGPLGNLLVSTLACLVAGIASTRRSTLRLYAVCVMAFGFCWEAGYLIFAMARNSGDPVFAWEDVVGPVHWTVRACGIVVGVFGYVLIRRLLAMRLRGFADLPGRIGRMLQPAWATGVIVMAAAASLYAPNRLGAVHDAALSAVAAFPLLFPFGGLAPAAESSPPIARDSRVIAVSLAVVLVFALTMGRGVSP